MAILFYAKKIGKKETNMVETMLTTSSRKNPLRTPKPELVIRHYRIKVCKIMIKYKISTFDYLKLNPLKEKYFLPKIAALVIKEN